ncbi:MAG: HNH endonuclease signature motif containing protein [Actinomycetota bacterium]|uniref:HNH endonuclease n=1 Tax=Mycobacterium lentiflavum TaxID=141349 RepID=A0ABY3UWP2_MYCLN|nr:HNH endonuclease signature motif containing protein [Mycobacterium lentiflavum]MEE3062739.1 HNH endonuclease signature motif containing protein [Actinomycetota bacterium]ULP44006.1 HNH endonuclease [Mycobacterium lentiflavum]
MFESTDPCDLVTEIESTQRQESMLVARRMAAVGALLRHRVAATKQAEDRRGYAVLDGFERTAAEVAAAMNLSPMAASYLVSYAESLDTRLPKLAALLSEGRTDWRTVRLIISRTDLITDDGLIAEVDRSLATRIGKWHGWSRQRIVNAVDATVRAVDPDAARERRETAANDRYIAISTLDNGMADVYGTVEATAATAFDRRLSQLAGQVCAGDPRTMEQRRADALAALTQGRGLVCRCEQSDCPAAAGAGDGEPESGGVRVVINVVASEQTVNANSDEPGYLEGYGIIDAEQVRELASAAAQLVADPFTTPVEALRYQPSAALERFVRCRDLTCRFPGCSRPAVVCDIDHTIPFNHQDPTAGGLTVAQNLKCLCRQHHRLKTFHVGWRDTQLGDGTVVWTSPSGRVYRTYPAGADLFPQPRGPACATPIPVRRDRSKQRRARISQARMHNRRQKARKEEVAARKFRNHMRNSLFAFKGAASTSPFCTWINEPREPEELPADWVPDAMTPLPDDPPY